MYRYIKASSLGIDDEAHIVMRYNGEEIADTEAKYLGTYSDDLRWYVRSFGDNKMQKFLDDVNAWKTYKNFEPTGYRPDEEYVKHLIKEYDWTRSYEALVSKIREEIRSGKREFVIKSKSGDELEIVVEEY